MKNYDVLIIGAGMTGISAALTFKEFGMTSLCIDKGRGYGGRMATRRISNNLFDHGAQYIQPSPRFLNWLKENTSEQTLHDWDFTSSKKVYIPKLGMSSLAKELSQNIEVNLNSKIISVEQKGAMWILKDETDKSYSSKRLLVTAPLPQTLELLQKNNIHIEDTDLSGITYRPCLVLMMTAQEVHNLPESGAMFIKNSVLEWVCDNKEKGINNTLRSITVHCTEEFSKDKYDLSDEKIFELIYSEFSRYFPNKLGDYEVKKWKYSSPLKYYKSLYFRSAFPGLYLAGDAFGGNSLDGAFRSGVSAAYVIRDDVLV